MRRLSPSSPRLGSRNRATLLLFEDIYYRERLHIRSQWQQVVALDINVLPTCHVGF